MCRNVADIHRRIVLGNLLKMSTKITYEIPLEKRWKTLQNLLLKFNVEYN